MLFKTILHGCLNKVLSSIFFHQKVYKSGSLTTNMRITKRILTAFFISIGYYISSLFLNIVPCQVSPNVPNPNYSWGFCTLNPDSFSYLGVQKIFFGFSSRPIDAILLAFLIPLIISFLVLSIKLRKHHKKEDK